MWRNEAGGPKRGIHYTKADKVPKPIKNPKGHDYWPMHGYKRKHAAVVMANDYREAGENARVKKAYGLWWVYVEGWRGLR